MKLLTALIPRAIILGLLLLLVWLNLPQLAERHLADELRRATGTELNLAEISRTRHLNRWYLNSLDWVDPRVAGINLLQAEEGFLSLSVDSLWRRKLQIEQLQLTQVRVATPRTITSRSAEIPALDPALSIDLTSSPLQRVEFIHRGQELPQQWIDRIRHPQSGYQNEAESFQKKLADFEKQWLQRAQTAGERAAQIQAELDQLVQSSIEKPATAGPNPLRATSAAPPPGLRLVSLREEKAEIEAQLAHFQQEYAALQIDLERFRTDVARLMSQTQVPETLDPQLANELVLGPALSRLASDWLNWIEHFHESAGKLQRDDLTSFARGRNVVFQGMRPGPVMQIDSLEISGAAVVAGQRVGIAGTIEHLTSDPHHQTEPTEFNLRAQTDQHWLINASIDRRQGARRDTLSVRSPATPIAGATWGNKEVLSLETGPATQQTEAELVFDGDAVSGIVHVTYGDLVFLVNHLHEMLGGQNVQLLLNHELASQSQVTVSAEISGTRQQPVLSIDSDWGQAFARHYNRIQAESVVRNHRREAEKTLDELQQELNRIRISTGGKVEQVTHRLGQGTQVFAQLEAWEQEQSKSGKLR